MNQRTEMRKDNQGRDMEVYVRQALDVNSKSARYTGFKQEKLLLKKGSIRLKGYKALPCNIVLERDVPVVLRDGVTIYTDVFRPADDQKHPAIMAMSPYGKDGAELVEWAAKQEWCNGKIGMSGNSWLAISQWFVAAQNPKHLAAIALWEGLSDCQMEVAARSGVPMPEFVKMLSDSFASTGEGGVEDVIAHMRECETRDAYWEDKAAELEKITVPAYIVASYTNPIHTYGTLEGYRRISSEKKWLRIHNTGEWDDYYNEAHTEDLRKFFDRYLQGDDNDWEETPKVRVSVLNPGGEDIIDRPEEDFPIPRTEYKKLYLNAQSGKLQTTPCMESAVTYNSDKKGSAVFTIWRLKLWIIKSIWKWKMQKFRKMYPASLHMPDAIRLQNLRIKMKSLSTKLCITISDIQEWMTEIILFPRMYISRELLQRWRSGGSGGIHWRRNAICSGTRVSILESVTRRKRKATSSKKHFPDFSRICNIRSSGSEE